MLAQVVLVFSAVLVVSSPPTLFCSFHLPNTHSVCLLLISASLLVSQPRGRCRIRNVDSFVIRLSIPLAIALSFLAPINLLANRQQSPRLDAGIRFRAVRMQEPESNPPLKGDPQTKTAAFCVSPQIPHLFKMKSKINLMTSIQCGQTSLLFFSTQNVVFTSNFSISA